MGNFSFPLLAAGLLTMAAPAGFADPLSGEYRGIMDGARPVPVILQLASDKSPGDSAGHIRFNEPWVCGFEIEYSGTKDQALIYSFKGAGAGPCRPFTQGYARLQQIPEGVQLELVGSDKAASQKIVLKPVTKPN